MDGSGIARLAAGLVCLGLVLGSWVTSQPEAASTQLGTGPTDAGDQQEAAIRAALDSTLKDAATAQESFRTANPRYTDDVSLLAAEGLVLSPEILFTIVLADKNGYCMNAAVPDAQLFHFYWSDIGAPQEGNCEDVVG